MTPDQGWLATGTMHFQRARECVLDVARQIAAPMPPTDILYDNSRFHNDGSMTNVTWSQLASGLWVMVFDGTSSVVDFGTPDILEFVNAPQITLEAWVYCIALDATHRTLMHKGTWTGNRIKFLQTAAGSLYLEISFNTGGHRAVDGGDMSLSAWHHVLAVYDGAAMILYQDTVATSSAWAGDTLVGDTTNPFRMGERSDDGNNWNGYISMSRIYNFALAPATILAHYNYEKGLFGL